MRQVTRGGGDHLASPKDDGACAVKHRKPAEDGQIRHVVSQANRNHQYGPPRDYQHRPPRLADTKLFHVLFGCPHGQIFFPLYEQRYQPTCARGPLGSRPRLQRFRDISSQVSRAQHRKTKRHTKRHKDTQKEHWSIHFSYVTVLALRQDQTNLISNDCSVSICSPCPPPLWRSEWGGGGGT
jgi:hypothetical protein